VSHPLQSTASHPAGGGLPPVARWGLALALLALAATAPARAQEGPRTQVVTIVNADSVAGEVVGGERVRRLIGRVHLRQDSTDLRAQRATQYLDRDQIVFEGNVSIADPSDTLRARRITYDSVRRVGRAQGGVTLSDAEAVIVSDSLVFFRTERRAEFQAPVRLVEREGGGVLTSRRGTYFTSRKEAFFEEDVRLEDSTSVLTSARGRYGTEDKRAEFSGEVRLAHQRSTRLRADTLTHWRDTERSEARGNVVVLRFGGREDPEGAAPDAAPDTTRRTLLFGGLAFHDERAAYSRVERGWTPADPLVARLSTDEGGVTDTLLVQATLFEAFQPEALEDRALPPGATLERLIGRGDVRQAGAQLGAVADSVVVDRVSFEGDLLPVQDEVRLFREPVAWLNARGSSVYTQLTGDTLRLTARGEALDSLHALGRAFAIRPDSALARENHLRGQRMLALFREDSLRALRVWPSAEALLFRADSLGRLEGAVQVSADSLSLRFRGEEVERISGVRGIEGQYLEAGLVPADLRLEGPPFAPERRPTRTALLAGRPPLIDPFAIPPEALPPVEARPPPLADPPPPVALPAEPSDPLEPSPEEEPSDPLPPEPSEPVPPEPTEPSPPEPTETSGPVPPEPEAGMEPEDPEPRSPRLP
jgi:lipopolysaccharide export system protein LptA